MYLDRSISKFNAVSEPLSNKIRIDRIFFYYWHRVSGAFAPTNPGAAQALNKELRI